MLEREELALARQAQSWNAAGVGLRDLAREEEHIAEAGRTLRGWREGPGGASPAPSGAAIARGCARAERRLPPPSKC